MPVLNVIVEMALVMPGVVVNVELPGFRVTVPRVTVESWLTLLTGLEPRKLNDPPASVKFPMVPQTEVLLV